MLLVNFILDNLCNFFFILDTFFAILFWLFFLFFFRVFVEIQNYFVANFVANLNFSWRFLSTVFFRRIFNFCRIFGNKELFWLFYTDFYVLCYWFFFINFRTRMASDFLRNLSSFANLCDDETIFKVAKNYEKIYLNFINAIIGWFEKKYYFLM